VGHHGRAPLRSRGVRGSPALGTTRSAHRPLRPGR
jgi:hypothetical protein